MASDLSLGVGRSEVFFQWHCRTDQFGTAIFGTAVRWFGQVIWQSH